MSLYRRFLAWACAHYTPVLSALTAALWVVCLNWLAFRCWRWEILWLAGCGTGLAVMYVVVKWRENR